jgi:signal peptidase II
MRAVAGLAIVATLVAADQISKFWVETNLPFHQPVELFALLSFYRTYNTGIAFSLFSFIDDWVLTALTVTIIAVVLWLWAKTEPRQKIARLGYAFVIGGALGNLIDRVRLGHVVDFILFHTQDWSFAIFNLADSFITVGAGLIILNEIIEVRRARNSDQTSG